MKNYASKIILTAAILTSMLTVGCYQGRPSEKTPIHLNPNMDKQEKYKAQEESMFFADGSAMRLPVEGTIARGWLREDVVYYTGINKNGDTVKVGPYKITMELLKRGQDRYNIYCSPCHSRTGDGQGIIVKRGLIPPPTFHEPRIRNSRDGHIFAVISNGIRNMPSYRHQIPVEDRWAIVAYFRALQRSHNAAQSDIPAGQLGAIK